MDNNKVKVLTADEIQSSSVLNYKYDPDEDKSNALETSHSSEDEHFNADHSDELATPDLLLKRGYSYIEMIGEGANGKTYKGRNLKTGEIVAIKELKFSNNLKNYELFQREADVLKSINTPGVPRFYDYIAEDGQFTECWLVQEYVKGKSILDLIQEKQQKNVRFREDDMLRYLGECAEIIRTLQTCYMPPIIHRDIKPSNILIRDEEKDGFSVCLIDFGAVANPQRRNLNSTVAGTVGYMPPEQLIGDCALQSDYYALGATGLHMLTNIAPSDFPSDGFTLLYEDKLKSVIPSIRTDILELFRRLLAPQITDRPHDAEELDNLFQKAIDNSQQTIEFQNEIKRTEKHLSIAGFSLFILIPMSFFVGFASSFSFFVLLIIIIATIILCYKFNCQLEKLRIGLKNIQKKQTTVQPVKKKQSPESNIETVREGNAVTATVAAIFTKAVEFYFEVDGKAVTYIHEYHNDGRYQIGDKIDIEYTKMDEQYQCRIVS